MSAIITVVRIKNNVHTLCKAAAVGGVPQLTIPVLRRSPVEPIFPRHYIFFQCCLWIVRDYYFCLADIRKRNCTVASHGATIIYNGFELVKESQLV